VILTGSTAGTDAAAQQGLVDYLAAQI